MDLETGYQNFYKEIGHDERKGFIRKVYGILSVQLTVTTLFIFWAMSSDGFRSWMADNSWFLIVCCVMTILIIIPLICCKKFARKVPTNYFLLFGFTVCESFLIANFTAQYEPVYVLSAMLLTAGVTFGITLYALTTKSDFTSWTGILCGILLGGLVFGLIFGFLIELEIVRILVCLAYIVIYSIYLVVDTQLIAGGRRYELSIDDYVLGALFLYVDIVGLFIYILSLIGGKK